MPRDNERIERKDTTHDVKVEMVAETFTDGSMGYNLDLVTEDNIKIRIECAGRSAACRLFDMLVDTSNIYTKE
ncbi:MAG: hypothetical protein ABIL58_12395 [Pseudomonadota bacterium]